MNTNIQETYYLDYKSQEIQHLVSGFRNVSEQEKIKQLYLKVRDGWRYNPFVIHLDDDTYKSSFIYQKPEGHCIDKAILYVSGLRALGISARIRLAKVSNHIAVERLTAKMGTNEIAPHGLAEVFYNGKWVKCSPAFNKELCELYNVAPLEFDGTYDSVFQEYNNDNAKFMEYLEDYGSFDEVPVQFIKNTFKNHYPQLYEQFVKHGRLQF